MTPTLVTLEEAASWLSKNMKRGADCPCCGQMCRIYRRAFNASMANSLIWLVSQNATTEWIDVPARAPGWLTKSREFPKSRYWGLIEEKPNKDPSKRCSGLWRPTKEGIDFVFSRSRIASHVYLFDNAVMGFEEKRTTSIQEALGKKFDYSELMAWSENSL